MDHLIALPGSPWACWRHLVVRSAGFPAERAREMSDDVLARATDAVLAAEADLERATVDATAAMQADLDRICGQGAGKGDPRYRPVLAALRSLRRGKLRKAVMETLGAEAGAALEDRQERVETARRDYLRVHRAALERQAHKLAAAAAGERFREAVTWQNREVVHTVLEKLARRPHGAPPPRRKERKYDQLVAKYLQRYSVKNDTIGFFGPVLWGRIRDRDEPLRILPGQSLVARRGVFLEGWCVEELAAGMTADFGVRRWFKPSWRAIARLRDGRLHLPAQPPVELPDADVRLLELVDGRATADEIARAARGEHFATDDEIFERLAYFADKNVLHWGFRVSIEASAAADLERQIGALPDPATRRACRQAFAALDDARREVARAAGQPRRLDRRLAELDETFTRLTGRSGTRLHGKFYSGRTLVYEECERDLELELGGELHRAIVEPLSIILRAARWFTYRAAREARTVASALYRELAGAGGSARVPATLFLGRIYSDYGGDGQTFLEPIFRDLDTRWRALLPEAPGDRHLDYTAAELDDRARELFDAPHAGWQKARYCNPDLLLAASSVDAVRAGDYRIVLGDLHVGRNVYNRDWLVHVHPDPDGMMRAMELDLPETRLIPLIPKDYPTLTTRLQTHHLSPNDFLLATGRPSSKRVDPARVVTIAELSVEDSADGLVLRTHDGRLRLDFVEALGDLLTAVAGTYFRVGTRRTGHGPRVTIDRLVVRRESWAWPSGALEFASEKDPARRFLAARRFLREHRLPRYVFYKAPTEPKPMWADFTSPVYVDLLAKSIRKSRELDGGRQPVVLSEMLPSFDELWLTDAEGRRYTSELRTLFVDQAGRPAPHIAGGSRWNRWHKRLRNWIT